VLSWSWGLACPALLTRWEELPAASPSLVLHKEVLWGALAKGDVLVLEMRADTL